jgi:carbamoyltransferase
MSKTSNIIGIHCTGILSSACLISKGKLVYGCSEERFSRIKNDSNFPILTIKHILKKFKLKLNDIDTFAIGWNSGENISSRFRAKYSTFERYPGDFLSAVPNYLTTLIENKKINQSSISFLGDFKSKITFVDHHLSHARLALEESKLEDALVLSTDAWGETKCTVIYEFKKNKLKTLNKVYFPNSIGCFYGAITNFLGFKPLHDEWKVMGMAAYGNHNNVSKNFFDIVKLLPNGEYQLDLKFFDFYNYETKNWYSDQIIKILGQPRNKKDKILKRHYDIAAAGQKLFTNVMDHIIKYYFKKTTSKNIILTGGCAMNSLYNGRLQNLKLFNKSKISFSPNDTGNSIGSAIEVNKQLNPNQKIKNISSFIGDSFKKEEIKKELDLYKIKYSELSETQMLKSISNILIQDKVIGLFIGKSEFGQRALGSRSIIASPRNKIMKEIVNKKIKYREPFRPFAPVIKIDDLKKIFDVSSEEPIMHMEKALKFREKFKKICPAVVHKDGTGRVQTVNKNSFFYKLINNFESLTNCPVLLNTSFNLNNEPMVHTPKDAIRTFYSSGMDCLVLENFLIEK